LKHHEVELGWKKEEASVRREEKLRRVLLEMKKGVLCGSRREAKVLAGWAAPRSWLRVENVRNKPHGGRGDQCARAGHAEHRGVCARVC
jgi:hypothetical protein